MKTNIFACNKSSAFSLIELMVVIAIVAILAAVAVPAYNNYIIGARMASAAKILGELAQQSISFSSIHGRFAWPADLDLGAGTYLNGNAFADSTAADHVLGNYSIGNLFMQDYSSNCGAVGYLGAKLSPTALGFRPDIATNGGAWGGGEIVIEYDFWHYNGVVYTVCFYQYGTLTGSGTDNILPGCVNINTTDGWDQNNRGPYQTGLTSFQNATCQ